MPVEVGGGGVNWWLRFSCKPAKTFIWRMADRYTVVLLCNILLDAIDMANSNGACSVAGIGNSCVDVQKLLNLLYPAEYVVYVEGERPRVMK